MSWRGAIALGLALVLASGAAAEPLRLARPASPSAFPRIAAPTTPATARINAALGSVLNKV